MSQVRFHQIRNIFEQALERPAEDRSIFLHQCCGQDKELIDLVRSMLNADAKESILDTVRGHLLHTLEGRRLGPYVVDNKIGVGGMGVVYKATRADDAFQKQVALKIIRPSSITPDTLKRFRQERQILAELDHANIARVLDGGTTPEGLPYLVMEYVDGRPIQAYCDANHLDVIARVKLFQAVCDAAAYAQRHLIVHRDLKPSNILVSRDGCVKLLDFGIAKLLTGDNDASAPLETHASGQIMTLAYASPEQILGQRVTTASDVYSLGIILFELLTGRRPYNLVGRALPDIVRMLSEQEATRPSCSLSSECDTPAWRKAVSGDLDCIVLKALRKDPSERYGSAEQLSDDLRRFLSGFPVRATRQTMSYQVMKFAKREKPTIVAGALSTLFLIFGFLFALYYANMARRAGQVSETMRQKAVAAEKEADIARRFADARAAEARAALLRAQGNEKAAAALEKEAEQYRKEAGKLNLIPQNESARADTTATTLTTNEQRLTAEVTDLRRQISDLNSQSSDRDEQLAVSKTGTKTLVTTAYIRVDSGTPDAEVLIDNKIVGKLSASGDFSRIPVTPDTHHTIRIQKTDHEGFETISPPAVAGQTILISSEARLRPFGTLVFEVQPPEAEITIRRQGDISWGMSFSALATPGTKGSSEPGVGLLDTPRKIMARSVNVPQGTYIVESSANQHEPSKKSVQVNSGQRIAVSMVLPRTSDTSVSAQARTKGLALLELARGAMGGTATIRGIKNYRQQWRDLYESQEQTGTTRTIEERFCGETYSFHNWLDPYRRGMHFNHGTGFGQIGNSYQKLDGKALLQLETRVFLGLLAVINADKQDGATIEAIDDHTVRIRSKSGFVIRLLLDTATNKPEALETEEEAQNALAVKASGPPLRRVFSNWRPVGGLLFPFTLDEFTGNKRLMSRQLLSMQINARRHCSFPPPL